MTTDTAPSLDNKPRSFGPLAYLGIILGVGFAVAKGYLWAGGKFTAEGLGYAMGSTLIPMLIAWGIASWKRPFHPTLFGATFCAICIVLFLWESNREQDAKQHLVSVIKEAAGTGAPTSSASDSTLDRLLRDATRNMLEIRKAHDSEVARFSDDLDQLYSAESFSSPSAIHRTLGAVRGTLSADLEFSKKFEGWMKGVEESVNHSSLSEVEKQDFMGGFRKSLGDSKILSVRTQIVEAESRWADATSDLYDFALTHISKISIQGSNINIADKSVEDQFNRKLHISQDARKDLHGLNAQLRQLQEEGMKQVGVTPNDLGLSK